jgi:O-antigen ligase
MVTFSRGGYVAFAAAGLTIAFFRNKVLFIAVTLALILAIINPVLLPKGIASRMSSTFRNDQIYASSLEEEVDSSAATRIAIWKGSLPMINDHKWFGIGYGVFPYLIPFYAPEVGEITPHNTYILIAAEMGIFALLAFLLVLLVIFRNSYKLYKMTQDKFFKALSLGMLGSLGGVLIANVFGGRLDSEELSSYFWILAALVFRALYIERKSKNTLLKKSQ